MMDERLINYLYEKLPQRNAFFQEMEQYAKKENIPIMDPYSMEVMLKILQLFRPERILEIGTAIGYSALRMADVLDARIVTIERDPERAERAECYIRSQNKTGQIKIIRGDALELPEEAGKHGPFDCIFIDAAKGQYKKFFELFTPYLNERGIVISDNVLFKGYVFQHDGGNKRLQKIAGKIKDYNDWLFNQPDFETVIFPVGDGLGVSIRT